MLDYLKEVQVEFVPSEKGTVEEFYLSHHAVKEEKRGGKRLRVVFDGSSHEDQAPTLNGALEMARIYFLKF